MTLPLPETPPVEIVFDCLPLRSIVRWDIPLDASAKFRQRCEHLLALSQEFDPSRTYFLYSAHCLYRFANSEVDGACRFEFEGAVVTDAGDRKTVSSQIDIRLTSDTCGGVPDDVVAWLTKRVEQAVRIEFDRFIAAGTHDERRKHTDELTDVRQLANFAGLGV